MAAISLPIPGSKYGPCVGECHHIDCALTRRDAKSKCTRCGEPIGYDVMFYESGGDPGGFIHATCLELELLTPAEEGDSDES